MDRSVKWILVLAVVLVGACGSATPSVAPTDAPPVSGSAAPEAIPSGATNATVPAIVGEWVGVHDCARIVAMLNEAGLEESLVDAIYGNELVPGVDPATAELVDPAKPCEGAVERAHSHFFTV